MYYFTFNFMHVLKMNIPCKHLCTYKSTYLYYYCCCYHLSYLHAEMERPRVGFSTFLFSSEAIGSEFLVSIDSAIICRTEFQLD